MRILVTGARGKVGAATVATLLDAGHDVTATDVGRPRFEADRSGVAYKQGDLTDAGDAYAIVRGHDAVVHAAAIPEPTRNPAHVGLREQPDGDVQHAGGRGALGRPPVREHLERDRPGLLLPRAAVRCPTTSRSTSSTRCARRIRTRPRSTSASS